LSFTARTYNVGQPSNAHLSALLLPEIELSNEILRILQTEKAPVGLREIMRQLTAKGISASISSVSHCLFDGLLREYVVGDERYCFTLKTPAKHEGSCLSSEAGSLEDTIEIQPFGPEEGLRIKADPVIAETLLEILAETKQPLREMELAAVLRFRGFDLGSSEVNFYLAHVIKNKVFHEEERGWRLRNMVPRSEEGLEQWRLLRRVLHQAASPKTTSIIEYLDCARRILVLLDRTTRALSVPELAWLLDETGSVQGPDIVRECVHSVLAKWIIEERTGYWRLRHLGEYEAATKSPGSQATRGEVCGTIVFNGIRFRLIAAPCDTVAFFSLGLQADTIVVTLNQAHAAWPLAASLLNHDSTSLDVNVETLPNGHSLNSVALNLLLSWAAYEYSLPARLADSAKEVREDWGRHLRDLVIHSESVT
jgi:hypothetical protein